MFIETVVVEELPNANRGCAKVTYTQEQADTFYRQLILAQGHWVKYFEATVKPNEIASIRHMPRNFIFSKVMKKYVDNIEYTTRHIAGVITAYARIK
jgi:hypothetical protein